MKITIGMKFKMGHNTYEVIQQFSGDFGVEPVNCHRHSGWKVMTKKEILEVIKK